MQFLSAVKQVIFLDVVGTEQEPVAKSLVLVVLFPFIVIYSILVSLMPSPRSLVATMCALFTGVFLSITALIVLDELENGKISPWIAWTLYFATEIRSVFMMPMVWSVIADVSTAEMSRKAYPFLFFVTQLGGIGGSIFAMQVKALGGQVGLLLLASASFAIIGGFSWMGCSIIAESSVDERLPISATTELSARAPSLAENAEPPNAERRSVSSLASAALRDGLAGLWLLLSRPYGFMVFFVSYAYLVPRSVLDYENVVLTKATFRDKEDQIAYIGSVSLYVNIGVALVSLLATRELVSLLGVARSLFVLPVVMAVSISMISSEFTLQVTTMAVVFASVVAYGLNQPCKEMLFVRTSRDIKYKAKSWSEMYGNHLMKMVGQQINLWINNDRAECSPACFDPRATMAISFGWIGLWMVVAWNVGGIYTQLDREEKIIS